MISCHRLFFTIVLKSFSQKVMVLILSVPKLQKKDALNRKDQRIRQISTSLHAQSRLYFRPYLAVTSQRITTTVCVHLTSTYFLRKPEGFNLNAVNAYCRQEAFILFFNIVRDSGVVEIRYCNDSPT